MVPLGLIDCDETCTSSGPLFLSQGANVTLRASTLIGSGQRFTFWSGDCVSGAPDVQVTMNAARNCIAHFEPEQQALQLSLIGNGQVVSNPSGIDCPNDCGASYDSGTLVTLTASPNPGWQFDNWSGGCSGTNPTLAITLNNDLACVATFSQPSGNVTLAVNKDGTGEGRVIAIQPTFSVIDCGPVCSDTLPLGTQVVLAPAAGSESNLENWTGCDQINFPQCLIDMTSSRSVTATFINLSL